MTGECILIIQVFTYTYTGSHVVFSLEIKFYYAHLAKVLLLTYVSKRYVR